MDQIGWKEMSNFCFIRESPQIKPRDTSSLLIIYHLLEIRGSFISRILPRYRRWM